MKSKKYIYMIIVIVMIMFLSIAYTNIKDHGENFEHLDLNTNYELDIKTFNEIGVMSNEWPHIGITRESRSKLLEEYAAKGSKVAKLSLKLFEIYPGSYGMKYDKQAYSELKYLAENEVPTAQCLLFLVNLRWGLSDKETNKILYEKAALKKVPHCMRYKAAKLRLAGQTEAFKKMHKEAAKNGDHFSQMRLAEFYLKGMYGFDQDIGKYLCWMEVSKGDYDTGESLLIDAQLKREYRKIPTVNKAITEYEANNFCGD